MRQRLDADRGLAATGQLATIVAGQLQRFDVNARDRAACRHQTADRTQQRVVADVGRNSRHPTVPVLVTQPQRLNRPARIDGGLEHGRVELPRSLMRMIKKITFTYPSVINK